MKLALGFFVSLGLLLLVSANPLEPNNKAIRSTSRSLVQHEARSYDSGRPGSSQGSFVSTAVSRSHFDPSKLMRFVYEVVDKFGRSTPNLTPFKVDLHQARAAAEPLLINELYVSGLRVNSFHRPGSICTGMVASDHPQSWDVDCFDPASQKFKASGSVPLRDALNDKVLSQAIGRLRSLDANLRWTQASLVFVDASLNPNAMKGLGQLCWVFIPSGANVHRYAYAPTVRGSAFWARPIFESLAAPSI